MQMDPRQCLAIVPKALQFALFVIPQGFRGTKNRDSNGLKLFGRVASSGVQSCSFIARTIWVIGHLGSK